MMAPECCVTCGGPRYCATLRCYCGHTECPAFASFVDITTIPLAAPPKSSDRTRSSWDNRKESTWIDRL